MAQIPSGGAPLYLGDLATPMNAVSQRLIGQMVDRVNKKQEQISKGQKEFLELLDFGTTEGLSDKTTERLLKKQQELEDWAAQEYLDSDMSLSLDKQLELRKAKRRYETEAANAKLDVTRFANAQKTLANPQSKYIYDLDKSAKELKRAQKAIENGESANWQILHLLPPTTGVVRELMKRFGDAKPRMVDSSNDYNQGKRFKRYSNVDDVERQIEMAMQDPLLDQFRDNVQVMDNIRSSVRAAAEAEKSEYTVSEDLGSLEMGRYKKSQEFEKLPEEKKEVVQKYPGFKNVKPEKLSDAIYYTDFVHRVLGQDEKTLETLKSKYLTGFGMPTAIDVRADGSTVLYNKNDEKFIIPSVDDADPDNKRQAMAVVLGLVPSALDGNEIPDNWASWMPVDYDVNIKERAPVTSAAIAKEALNVKDSDIGDEWEYTEKGKKKTGKVLDKTYREVIVKELKQLFPDDTFDVKNTWGDKRYFKWGKDEFDLSNEEGRQQLRDKIDRRVKELRGGNSVGSSGGTSNINPNADVEDLPEGGF